MSVHENEHTSAVVHSTANSDPRDAEATIAAFLIALGELGYDAPNNSYRAIVTRSGLQVEVFADAPDPRTEDVPVEEIAEMLHPRTVAKAADAPLANGDKVRVTAPGRHGFAIGDELTLDRAEQDADGYCFATSSLGDGSCDWIKPAEFERVA